MLNVFPVAFAGDQTSVAIRIASEDQLDATLQALNLQYPRPVLALVGGASKMAEADLAQLQSLFVEALVPVVEQMQAIVVDGGTDAGVIHLMGQARNLTGANFPLVGVAPAGVVSLPDTPSASPEAAQLEPHHTHFVLIPGSNWGDDSPWLAQVASVLSTGLPSVTLLINGGEIALKDVEENIKASRRVITLAGSGRLADRLAASLAGHVDEPRLMELASSQLVQAVNLSDGPQALRGTIETILQGG